MRIYFDMDGTIANLYKNENWLEQLRAFKVEPYRNAERLVEEKVLLKLMEKGFELGIVSWCAGYHNNKEYDKQVRQAKKEWLKENYPNVVFKEVHIVKFGKAKWQVVQERNAILVDDEEPNRKAWKGLAIEPKEIEKFL